MQLHYVKGIVIALAACTLGLAGCATNSANTYSSNQAMRVSTA